MAQSAIREYVTVLELAEILHLSARTIYNKISSKEWGEAQGVQRLVNKVRIHFPTFKAKSLNVMPARRGRR